MRTYRSAALLVSAALVSAAPALASGTADTPSADAAKEKKVCKRTQRTGTRFYTEICKTAAEWAAIEEQSKRDAREMIDRPLQNTQRDN